MAQKAQNTQEIDYSIDNILRLVAYLPQGGVIL
jgi:hypothetical protein